MCQIRRQDRYKPKWVCTACEKAFKDNAADQPFFRFGEVMSSEEHKKCPECSKLMEFVSSDFRAPKRGDRQWRFIRKMQALGIPIMRPHLCGCVGRRYPSRIIPKTSIQYEERLRVELTK